MHFFLNYIHNNLTQILREEKKISIVNSNLIFVDKKYKRSNYIISLLNFGNQSESVWIVLNNKQTANRSADTKILYQGFNPSFCL